MFTLNMFLHVVVEYETTVTQSTVLWILHSMNLYVSPYVVHGDEFLDTQSTDI